MKIAITTVKLQNLFANGLKFNITLWCEFFKNCGFNVTLVSDSLPDEKNPLYGKYKFLNFLNLWEDNKLKTNYENDCKELLDFDVVFHIGLSYLPYFNLLKKHNVKLIFIMLGSTYHNDVNHMISEKLSTGDVYHHYDEVWLSPHFQYVQEYYKIRYKTDNVFLCPFFWRDDLFKQQDNIMNKVLTDTDKLKVAIVEPNFEQAKNCIIPIAICEKAEKYIHNVKVFNSFHLRENKFFKSYILGTELQKNKKITVEKRYALPYILTEHCNCIVSCVEDCDLNYVFLECFYLGVPLIHNSPLLKDYGYYYPKFNVSKGAEQIKNVIQNHNREEYIQRHKSILAKYSIHNPIYKQWVISKLRNQVSFDCL
jgi:hypothetical protein